MDTTCVENCENIHSTFLALRRFMYSRDPGSLLVPYSKKVQTPHSPSKTYGAMAQNYEIPILMAAQGRIAEDDAPRMTRMLSLMGRMTDKTSRALPGPTFDLVASVATIIVLADLESRFMKSFGIAILNISTRFCDTKYYTPGEGPTRRYSVQSESYTR